VCIRAAIVFCCLLLLTPVRASAQDQPLARTLVNFFTEAVRMTSGSGSPGNPHEVHFLPGLSQQAAPFELHKAIVAQIATFPLGTSSGGFTYTLDPTTGAVTPASRSFGPSFAERPLTIGRGQVSTGIQYQHVVFSSFEDVDLEDGDIRLRCSTIIVAPPATTIRRRSATRCRSSKGIWSKRTSR
jgi:hypothetical protein